MSNATYRGPAIPDAPETYRTTAAQRSMSTARAAEIMGTTDRQIRRLIAAGALSAYRLGRVLRVTEAAIGDFQTRSAVQPRSTAA